MREKVYVDRLFAGYENTPEITDFKEEITGNLKERIKELVSNGLSDEEAFEKATAELGDITAIADDMGKKKRNEIISQMYTKAKAPFTKRTVTGLAIISGLLPICVAVVLYISTFYYDSVNWYAEEQHLSLAYYVSAFLLAAACGMYTFAGLTQETPKRYAMKNKRASAYGIASMLGVLGSILLSITVSLSGEWGIVVLATEIAMALIAVCILAYLIATEGDRQKLHDEIIIEREAGKSKAHNKLNNNKTTVFVVSTATLWILALVAWAVILLAKHLTYAWVAISFAFAVQVLLAAQIFIGKITESRIK